jgi:hypothetical protein
MNTPTTFFLTLALASALLLSDPTTADASKRNNAPVGLKLVDAVLVRPPMFVLSLVGSGLYLGTTPLTVPTGIADQTAKVLYRRPWKFTNGRRLGQF